MPASEVFHKYKARQLHSGSKSGPTVKNRAQAIAIYLSEKRAEGRHGGKYPEKQLGGPQFGTGQTPFPGHFGLNPPPMMPPQAQAGGLAPPFMGQMPQGLGAPQMGMGMRADGGNVVDMSDYFGGASSMNERLREMPTPKQQTMNTLNRALGVTGKVLPITPDDGKAAGGGLGGGYQFGGSPTSMGLTPGWIERQEARNISHTGPIISAVGGRTDHHSINVPSGSYVLPAAHVSAMGQGNTLNGMKILQGMFGPPMKLPHGAGPPRPPHSLVPKAPGLGMADGGDVLPFPPSTRLPAGRRQIRDELLAGKAKYEAGLSGPKMGPITIGDIQSYIPDESRGGPIMASGGTPLDIRPKVKNPPPWIVNPNSGGAYNAPVIPTDVDQFLKFRVPPSGDLVGQPKMIPQIEGLYSSGGQRGDNTGRPVPIMASGGEYVLGPEQVARVGKGNLDHGHAILDHWVKKTHKKFAKTVANLPPPAKS